MKRPADRALPWRTEAELCEDFTAGARALGWTVYPETAGFDLLLAGPDGVQIGVEAKLRPNLAVVAQLCRHAGLRAAGHPRWGAPDYLCALIGRSTPDFGTVIGRLGFELIDGGAVTKARGYDDQAAEWFERHRRSWSGGSSLESFENPWAGIRPEYVQDWSRFSDGSNRCPLPDFVPDLRAGVPSPLQLTPWKVKAIRLCALLRERGWVTTADFKALDLSPTTWTRGPRSWLVDSGEREGRRSRLVARPGVKLPDEQRPELTRQVLAQEAPCSPRPIVSGSTATSTTSSAGSSPGAVPASSS